MKFNLSGIGPSQRCYTWLNRAVRVCWISILFASCQSNETAEKPSSTILHSIRSSSPDSINAFRVPDTILYATKKSKSIYPSASDIKETAETRQRIPEPDLHFNHFNTEDGLALSSVLCSYFDQRGNLWLGTQGAGLSKFDGHAFTNYSILNGLSHNTILCIAGDKNGHLWFGTDGGGTDSF